MSESWGQLAANAAALKAGDLEGLSSRATVRQDVRGGGLGCVMSRMTCAQRPALLVISACCMHGMGRVSDHVTQSSINWIRPWQSTIIFSVLLMKLLHGSSACISVCVCCCVVALQDFAAPPGIPGVGASSSANSLVNYSQAQHSTASSSGLLLDPSLPPDALAVTLAAKRAILMERESALQVTAPCIVIRTHVVHVCMIPAAGSASAKWHLMLPFRLCSWFRGMDPCSLRLDCHACHLPAPHCPALPPSQTTCIIITHINPLPLPKPRLFQLLPPFSAGPCRWTWLPRGCTAAAAP
jgi:hypothetical protein